MKILTFIHSFEPGGVEKVALRLVAAWQAMGHFAPVFVGRADGALKSSTPENIDLRIPKQPLFNPAPFETLWMMLMLPRIILAERPDILFCAGNSYSVVAVLMKLLLGRSCPVIVAKISNDLYRNDLPLPVRWLYRLWLLIQGRLLDVPVGMAEPMRDEISTLMAVDPNEVAIIHDPALSNTQIDRLASIQSHRRVDARDRKFLAIGRLAKQKNYGLLIKAFAAGRVPGDRLAILGEGPERPKLENMIQKLALDDSVELPGMIDDPTPWLVHSDIFVLSSDYEGVPAVLLEALAAGLQIIATDCSVSLPSLLGGGTLGQIVPVRDYWSLATEICQCQPGHQPIEDMREKARLFTIERSAEAYVSVMQKGMNDAKPIKRA